MGISCHQKCIIFSLLLLTKTLLSEQVIDSERKNLIQNLNDPEFRLLLTKNLARHPLGLLLGHVLIQAVDKSKPNIQESIVKSLDPMSVRDRRYETSALNDQSFLRFGRNSNKRIPKRPNDNFDLNDTSFLRFGRSRDSDN